MKKFNYIFIAILSLSLLAGCEKEDNNHGKISQQAKDALLSKFPTAVNIEWYLKNGYSVAEFKESASPNTTATDITAWFDNIGKWYMTETDIRFDALPESVKTSFQNSEYASWIYDDIDKLEREGVETIYVIEVENRIDGIETDIDLYYSANGTLIKKITDADEDYDYYDYIPSQCSDNIKSFLDTNYPNARILDIDKEDGMTEIEILDGKTCREVMFSAANEWIMTKTEMTYNNIPETIKLALSESNYNLYRIDDIDYYETPEKQFYRFDLKSASGDIKIDIANDGTISVVVYDPSISNNSFINETVKNNIMAKYPNAIIRDFDFDDGLLEVEIYHENKEKDVFFNGSNQWIKTEWDIRRNELPVNVTNAINNSQYALYNYNIDDIEYLQNSKGDFYCIELELGNSEITLKITPSGNIQ